MYIYISCTLIMTVRISKWITFSIISIVQMYTIGYIWRNLCYFIHFKHLKMNGIQTGYAIKHYNISFPLNILLCEELSKSTFSLTCILSRINCLSSVFVPCQLIQTGYFVVYSSSKWWFMIKTQHI